MRSIERARQPIPGDIKLKVLQAKVWPLESQAKDKGKEDLSCCLTRQSVVGLEYRVFHSVFGLFQGRAFVIQC